MAIIEELSTEWDPDRYTDCYRERLRKVIESKRKGRDDRGARGGEGAAARCPT